MNAIVYIKSIHDNKTKLSAVGVIVCDNWGRVLRKKKLFIGKTTPLQAEFYAVLSGLSEAQKVNATSLKVFSDSEIIIKHMTGVLKVKEDEIGELLAGIKKASQNMSIEFIQIHSMRNQDAEALAKEAMQKGQESAQETQRLHPAGGKKHKGGIDAGKAEEIEALAFKRAMLLEDIASSTASEESSAEEEGSGDDIFQEEREEQQISAGGIVYKKEGHRVYVCLISKRKGRIWALPKGRVAPGEHIEDTARREIAEETGHLTQVKDIIDEVSYYFYVKEENIMYHKTVYFFLMPVTKENFCTPDGEADDIAWFPPGDAYKKLTYINEKEVLKKALKILKNI